MHSKQGERPNWLFRGLVCISLLIHLVVFIYASGLYNETALGYIELTLQDISKPPTRGIPRPRHRPKTPRQPREMKRLKITRQQVPHFKPIRVEPVDGNLPDTLVERISTPNGFATPGLKISKWSPLDTTGESGSYPTYYSYLEMVKLKIERHKEYPDVARTRQIEGRVTVTFVITPEGGVRSAEVVETSGHAVLDTAALRAVNDAAPFPRPPLRLFKGAIPCQVTVVFELT